MGILEINVALVSSYLENRLLLRGIAALDIIGTTLQAHLFDGLCLVRLFISKLESYGMDREQVALPR
jgi:hypothetical protein